MGSDCLIASGCKFIDHDHGSSRRDLPMALQVEGAKAAIFLEEDVWPGRHADRARRSAGGLFGGH
jgi:hypothetical protein